MAASTAKRYCDVFILTIGYKEPEASCCAVRTYKDDFIHVVSCRYLSKDGGVDGAAKGPSDAIANVATQMRRVVFEEQELGVSNRWTPRFRALR